MENIECVGVQDNKHRKAQKFFSTLDFYVSNSHYSKGNLNWKINFSPLTGLHFQNSNFFVKNLYLVGSSHGSIAIPRPPKKDLLLLENVNSEEESPFFG